MRQVVLEIDLFRAYVPVFISFPFRSMSFYSPHSVMPCLAGAYVCVLLPLKPNLPPSASYSRTLSSLRMRSFISRARSLGLWSRFRQTPSLLEIEECVSWRWPVLAPGRPFLRPSTHLPYGLCSFTFDKVGYGLGT